MLVSLQQQLVQNHQTLLNQARDLRRRLENHARLLKFQRDIDDVQAWVRTTATLASMADLGKDVGSSTSLLRKHSLVINDIASREKSDIAPVLAMGLRLVDEDPSVAPAVEARTGAVGVAFAALKTQASLRRQQLENAVRLHEFTSACNVAESWLLEREAQAADEEAGRDVAGSESLLRRHALLESELQAYAPSIQQLRDDCGSLAGLTIMAVPTRKRLKALYAYQGRRKTELSFAKGDTFLLIEQSNAEWWNVEAASGATGYVPANYVKEIKDKDAPTATAGAEKSSEANAASQTMASLEALWERVLELARRRRALLEAGLFKHRVLHEQNEIESWLSDRFAVARAGLERTSDGDGRSDVGGAELSTRAEHIAALHAQLAALHAQGIPVDDIIARQRALDEQFAALQALARQQQEQRAAQQLIQG
jgi:hypothetical protein